MALLHLSPSMLCAKKPAALPVIPYSSSNIDGLRRSRRRAPPCGGVVSIRAFCNPFEDQPILKDALKDPVAFMGGVFAGLLRLDLNEDPLREWVARTVEASGVAAQVEADAEGAKLGGGEDEPQEIEIE